MYKISQTQLQALANYLISKPYIEVQELIKMISTLEKIKEDDTISE
jgi:hypothetical protein